jgi:ankyrin repeat protein
MDNNEYKNPESAYGHGEKNPITAKVVFLSVLVVVLAGGLLEVWGRVIATKIHDDFIFMCRYGTPLVVRMAIFAGADVNKRNARGDTALMLAAEDNKNPGVVEALLEGGADVNADNGGWTALVSAATFNPNPEVVSLLLEHGADVNAETEDGWSPLLMAVKHKGGFDVIKTLIAHGADVNFRSGRGESVMEAATLHNRDPRVISALIDAGADAE